MQLISALILAATATLSPADAPNSVSGIQPGGVVDCEARGALERALGKAEQLGELDLRLDGVCRGYYRIAGGTVTLRGLTPDSGLAVPEGDPLGAPLLEIDDANVALRGLIVRGGSIGVHAHGSDAELLLYEVDVHDQGELGVLGTDGARVRPIESIFRGAAIGIVIDSATANVQRSTIGGRDAGVIVTERSFAAINDSTIEGCSDTGLFVSRRSDVNVLGGAFRENGSVHVGASDFSTINLLFDVQLGSIEDETSFSLAVTRDATITSYTNPQLHGDVSALYGGSIRLGNAVLEGDVQVSLFADVHMNNVDLNGSVVCSDGADAYCRNTTTDGAFECRSTSCGDEPAGATAAPDLQPPALPTRVRPAFEMPGPERLRRVGPAR